MDILKKIWNTPDQTGEAVTLRVKGSDDWSGYLGSGEAVPAVEELRI